MTTLQTGEAQPDLTASFESQATDALRQMRSALGALIAGIPGGVTKPVELQNALGIDVKLSWSVFQIIGAVDLLAGARNVPGSRAMRKLLRAAAQHGVAPSLIQRVSQATEDFDRLVRFHAGDLPTFDLMISGRASNGPNEIHLTHRRDVFRGNSHIWGVQAKTMLLAHFLQAGSDEGLTDGAAVRGLIGFRRIRPNVPWVIARARCVDMDGVVRRAPERFPLEMPADAAGGTFGAPFLTEFCSQPLPECRRIERTDGYIEHQLVEGPVGSTAAITCVMGDVVRNAATRYCDEHNRNNEYFALVRTPCEVLINDLFVDKDLFGPLKPELIVYGDLLGGPEYPAGGREPPRLPVQASADYLGRGPGVIATPDVPRYVELAQHVFDRLGWDGQRFDVYRVRVAYPILSSIVVMRHPLHERTPSP
jgi:hypothetical protein